jgi:hypothetical protein
MPAPERSRSSLTMLAVISILNLCFEDALIWVRVVEISNDRAVMRQRHDGTVF